LTPLVRRRGWTEPSIRVWWLLAIVLLGLILIYALDNLWSWGTESHLIRQGTVVQATVVEANINAANPLSIHGENVEPDAELRLKFDWHGKPVQVVGQLDGRTERIAIGQIVPIRVDPNNPSRWTYRAEPASLAQSLFIGLALLPILPLLIIVAAIKRKKLLRIWQQGEAVVGIVADRRQTPIAPRTYAIRCSLRDHRDKRLHTVYVPRGGTTLNPGDPIWLLIPRQRGAKAVAAAWFE
jgi:hypothetical protein